LSASGGICLESWPIRFSSNLIGLSNELICLESWPIRFSSCAWAGWWALVDPVEPRRRPFLLGFSIRKEFQILKCLPNRCALGIY
jgi:hypothetical protein